MIKYIATICSLFITISLFAQSSYDNEMQTNLQKYSNYRTALRNDFVVAVSNALIKQGTNYPAMRMFWDSNSQKYALDYGDGGGGIQYYIGLLATEYALLKMSGQDYSTTKNELSWALDAVDRIDSAAEKYYRSNHSSYSTDINGFLLRDDINEDMTHDASDFLTQYPSEMFYIFSSCYKYGNETNDGPVISRDIIWNYFINLALVVTLVDDNNIVTHAKNIVYNMVKWMKNGVYSFNGDGNCWAIVNPINSHVQQSDYIDMGITIEGIPYYLSLGDLGALLSGGRWGFAKAAAHITGTEAPYSDLFNITAYNENDIAHNFYDLNFDDLAKQLGSSWDISATVWTYDQLYGGNIYHLREGDQMQQYSYRSLATIIGKNDLTDNLYGDLVTNLFSWAHIASDGFYFEHMPLIYAVLHGYNDPSLYSEANNSNLELYLNLFKELPECNEVITSESRYTNTYTWDWNSDNRLEYPNAIGFSAKQYPNGVYISRIDFMLLHNLVWLTYYKRNKPNTIINSQTYLSSTANTFGPSDCINETSDVKSGASFTDLAIQKITLLPGFKAEAGCHYQTKFFRNINYILPNPDCTGLGRHNSTKAALISNPVSHPNSSKTRPAVNSENLSSTLTAVSAENLSAKTNFCPNPTNGSFNVSIGLSEPYSIMVYSISGNFIKEIRNCFNTTNVDISEQPSGIYVVKVLGQSSAFIGKLIKN